MSQLDPQVEYLLDGQKSLPTSILKNDTPPRILQVKLSVSLLEAVLSNSKDIDKSPRLSFINSEDAMIRLLGEDHHLQHGVESSPHQLYSIESGSKDLKLIGDVVSKLHIRQTASGTSSSTAASRLKERRELEEARKSEHRTVLIESPLLGESRSKGSSKLKLRPKGLAPSATNSPLIRSRAGTPAEPSSVPASPTFQPNHLPVKTPPSQSPSLPSIHANLTKPSPLSTSSQKRTTSPTGVRRRLIMTLAKGPLSRRDLVQQSQLSETSVLGLLDHIANVAPDQLQIPKENVKRYSGPVNRKSSTQSHQVSLNSGKDEKGPGTVYLLKDAVYKEVLSEDWAEYSDEEVLRVSEYTEAALKRQKLDISAEEWKKLHSRGRGPASVQSTDVDGQDLRRRSSRHNLSATGEKDLESIDLHIGNSKKRSEDVDHEPSRAIRNKNSVFSRINKASKGKIISPVSNAKTANATKTNRGVKKTRGRAEEVAEEDFASRSVAPNDTKATLAGSATKVNTRVGSKTETTIKGSSRKDIEYTDSSESNNDEAMQTNDRAKDPILTPTRRMAKSSSEASDGHRQRKGVGSGAAFSSEPWLDVRSRNDWNRLAERFKRVYQEYTLGRTKLCEEEKMIKSELELAQLEQTSTERSKAIKLNENRSSLQNDNDPEEGEASPTNASSRIITSADPVLFHNVKWRQNSSKRSIPMSIEELQLQIRQVQELESQLNRMKGTLKSTKRTLQSVTA